MCDVKLARLRTSADKPDNWIDLAGYAVCGYSVTQRDDKPIADDPDTFVFKVGDRVRDALGEGIIINHTCNALTVAFDNRSEEHTSELQSLMRISYAVFCLKKKTYNTN